jgi:hypothetical protein
MQEAKGLKVKGEGKNWLMSPKSQVLPFLFWGMQLPLEDQTLLRWIPQVLLLPWAREPILAVARMFQSAGGLGLPTLVSARCCRGSNTSNTTTKTKPPKSPKFVPMEELRAKVGSVSSKVNG